MNPALVGPALIDDERARDQKPMKERGIKSQPYRHSSLQSMPTRRGNNNTHSPQHTNQTSVLALDQLCFSSIPFFAIAIPKSIGAFSTTPLVCYTDPRCQPRWRTNARCNTTSAAGTRIVRGEAHCDLQVHRGMCCCKAHCLFSKAILRGQSFYDGNGNPIVLLGTERDEAERCVNSCERNIANAQQQNREECADRMAIPENRTTRNTQQNERRTQNTTTQEIRENIDYIYSWLDDNPDSAAITKGYLIYLLKDRVPRSPRLLENHPDPSLERHSNPQVMLAKCPECLGFFSSDATVNVIENLTKVEFDAESVKLAICSIRMCWDMQKPYSEANGGPSHGNEFPKHSITWCVKIFTTEGTTSFSLPPYKSCQHLPGDPVKPLSAEQEAVVEEAELFGRACKNFTYRANAILGTRKSRIRFLREQQHEKMYLTRRQARTLVTHEFGHPVLHGARDELLAIIGLDSSGDRQFLPQQGLFASDLQHGIFNGQLFAFASGKVSQTVIPWYKEIGYPSSKSRTMLLDVGLINQIREIGQQQFGISVLESQAREFLMQFFCEGTIEKRNDNNGWKIRTLIDNDDVLESLHGNSLEDSFGIDAGDIWSHNHGVKVVRLGVGVAPAVCKLAKGFTLLETAKFGGLDLLASSPPWKRHKIYELASKCQANEDEHEFPFLLDEDYSVGESSDDESLEMDADPDEELMELDDDSDDGGSSVLEISNVTDGSNLPSSPRRVSTSSME